jgi:hypothetical protein
MFLYIGIVLNFLYDKIVAETSQRSLTTIFIFSFNLEKSGLIEEYVVAKMNKYSIGKLYPVMLLGNFKISYMVKKPPKKLEGFIIYR